MFWKKKKQHHFYQNKLFLIFGFVILFAVFIRVMIPPVTTAIVNKQLAKQSPNFAFHIDDIDLYLLKGTYVVKGISGSMKPEGENFLNINSVVTEIPWKNIFKGVAVVDVVMNKMQLTASQALLDKAKAEGERLKQIMAEKKKEKPEEKEAPPVKINSFAMKDSSVTIKDFMSFKGDDTRTVSDIDVLATNLTPDEERPDTNFKVNANVFGPAPFVAVGVAQLKAEPLKWDVNSELLNFDLTTVSPFVKDQAQAVIKKGNMNFYAEAASQDGKIKGYAKPFVSKLKMDTPPGGFKFKGAAAAAGGNLVKVLLTDSEAKTLATELPFEVTQKGEKMDIKYEIIPALQKAVVHKAKQNIPEGLNDNIGEKGLGLEEAMQAEEAQEK